MSYVPDIGDTFTVTETHGDHTETHGYRVNGWMRRRPPRPEPRSEQEAMTREVLGKMITEGRIEGPRGAGPDGVPLSWCRREEAEYVSGAGVAGVIARVTDVTVTGRADWPEDLIQAGRDHANRLAGEPLT